METISVCQLKPKFIQSPEKDQDTMNILIQHYTKLLTCNQRKK